MRPTRTIYNDYAYLAECQLATLAGLCMKKSATKSSVKRHTSLAMEALTTCLKYKEHIKWESGATKFFGRVKDILDAAAGQKADSGHWARPGPLDQGGTSIKDLKVALGDQILEWERCGWGSKL